MKSIKTILQENITTLCTYIVENHIDSFKEHSYVETFKGLKLRYDQEQDKAKSIAERFLFRFFSTIEKKKLFRNSNNTFF